MGSLIGVKNQQRTRNWALKDSPTVRAHEEGKNIEKARLAKQQRRQKRPLIRQRRTK